MNDHPDSTAGPAGGFAPVMGREPGVPLIRNVNWGGLRALYIKAVSYTHLDVYKRQVRTSNRAVNIRIEPSLKRNKGNAILRRR